MYNCTDRCWAEGLGVAASEGVLRLTLRGQYEEEMDNLQRNIEQITEEQAKIYGLECYFEFDDVFPETKNHEESVDKIKAVCKDLVLNVLICQILKEVLKILAIIQN